MVERVPFPIVIGCGRSGTTLTRALLNAHPQMAIPDESYFPVWLGRNRAKYERPNGFAVAQFTDDVLVHHGFAHWGLDPERVRDGLRDARPATFADAVRTCYALYAEAHGKPRYGDKTPIFVLHVPMLAAMFPEAVFIHLVRDGRDVVLSRVAASWGSERLDHEALQWKSHVEQGRAAGAALGPERYLEVRYDELLDDTERVAQRLCEFTRLPFDPVMLRYYEQADAIVGTMAIPDEHQNLRRPPTKGLRDWRTELTADQVALFEYLAGDTLQSLGYELAGAPVPAGVRARALQGRARYAIRSQYVKARAALWRTLHPNAA
jgi:hypothetical protein